MGMVGIAGLAVEKWPIVNLPRSKLIPSARTGERFTLVIVKVIVVLVFS
jgi:hypothetical protein